MADMKLQKAIREAIRRATKPRVWPATLVGAGSRTGYSRVRFSNGLEMEVLNLRLANIANLKVRVGYDPIAPSELQVLGIREQFSFVGAVNNVVQWIVDHHANHEYPNHDTVWVRDAQFLPLLALPTGSGFGVKLYGGAIAGQSGYIWIADQTIDLAMYQPASGALWALIQASRADGTISVKVGATKATKGVLTIADIPPADSGCKALCAVQLYDGQTKLQRDPRRGKINDFVDLRWGENEGSGGTPSGTPNSVAIFNGSGALGTDAELLWNSAEKYLQIGAESPAAQQSAIAQASNGLSAAHFLTTAGAGFASFIAGLFARGTLANPSAVQADDILFCIRGRGHDGETWSPTQIEIRLVANENWLGGTNRGTRLEIWTTPNGSTTMSLVAVIDNAGNLNLVSGEYKINGTALSSIFAPAARGVTNGDLHDHNGGDGAPITENALSLSDVTINDASTSTHGFAPKAIAPPSGNLNVLGIGYGETVRSEKALFDDAAPSDIGLASSAGTSLIASRSDHTHRGDHNNLANIGTNSHANIDAHIALPRWTTIRKTTNQAKSNNTTLASDNELFFTASPNGIYAVRGRIWFDTSATADFKFRLLFAGTSIYVHRVTIPAGGDTETVAIDTTQTVVALLGSGTTAGFIEFDAYIVCDGAARTFAFQWAQNTSDAANTIVLAGSYIEFMKIN